MLPVAAASCSNGGGTPDGGGNDATTDVSPDVIIDPQNCVAPGTKPNDQGIGGYCSPGGGQCDNAGPGGSQRICTADVPGTPAHAWFCTLPCDPSINCGAGAQCINAAQGSGCVPNSCDYLEEAGAGDSGSDSSTDSSTSDGASDAGDAAD